MPEKQEQHKPEQKKPRGAVMRALSFLSQTGFAIAACLFIGVFLGRWLDRVLDTSPWLLLLCSLLGVAAAFTQIFALAKRQ